MLPRLRSRLGNVLVSTICKADRVQTLRAKSVYIAGGVIYVNVRANLLLILHKAQIPVRNAVQVEPVNSLFYGHLVEKVNEEPVRRREAGQHSISFYKGWGSGDHLVPPLKPLLNFARRSAVMFMP